VAVAENETKSVRAAVLAQRETGAPLMIHPGRNARAPFEILDLVRREGGDLGRTIMCHVERTIADRGQLFELAATGVYTAEQAALTMERRRGQRSGVRNACSRAARSSWPRPALSRTIAATFRPNSRRDPGSSGSRAGRRTIVSWV